ncbi:MAG: hypothetical protein AAGH81_09630 [Bacteroidota bacterium]
MNPFKIISRIQPIGLWHLLKLAVPYVTYLWPTYRATKTCMELSTEHFGEKHYQNGQANAFRHALWNVLIAKYCTTSTKATFRALNWTKKITDWHEETFFSKELPMKMDYHNNEVGRNLFEEHPKWSQVAFVQRLLALTENALKINLETNLNQLKNRLVYVSDDH